ncbi:GTPase-activating protein [Dispira parvispora]|uniref:GTPase-activating protein n=1 Tax=Dispira parvispora TaxID=1520584 RepID=A0A9W8ASB0_9FUNG|nr:GTPase-activating protein [Dispira parvispora]
MPTTPVPPPKSTKRRSLRPKERPTSGASQPSSSPLASPTTNGRRPSLSNQSASGSLRTARGVKPKTEGTKTSPRGRGTKPRTLQREEESHSSSAGPSSPSMVSVGTGKNEEKSPTQLSSTTVTTDNSTSEASDNKEKSRPDQSDTDDDDEAEAVVISSVTRQRGPSQASSKPYTPLPTTEDSSAARPVSQIVAFNQVNLAAASRPKIIDKSQYIKSPMSSPFSASRKNSITSEDKTSVKNDVTSPPVAPSRPKILSRPEELGDQSPPQLSTSPTLPLSASSDEEHSVNKSNAPGLQFFDIQGKVDGAQVLGKESPVLSAGEPPSLWSSTPSTDQSPASDRQVSKLSDVRLSPPIYQRRVSASPAIDTARFPNPSPTISEPGAWPTRPPLSANSDKSPTKLAIRLTSPVTSPSRNQRLTLRKASAGVADLVGRGSGSNGDALHSPLVGSRRPRISLGSHMNSEPLASSSYLEDRQHTSSPSSTARPELVVSANGARLRTATSPASITTGPLDSTGDSSLDQQRGNKASYTGLSFVNQAYGKFSSLFNRTTTDPNGSAGPALHSAHYEQDIRQVNDGLNRADSVVSGRSALSPNTPGTPDSIAPSDTSTSTSTSGTGTELLLARLEAQNSANQEDPKAARVAMEALRRSWLMIKESTGYMAKGDSEIISRDDSKETAGAAPAQIDWDFWGSLVSDYEGVVKKHSRLVAQHIQGGIPSALRGTIWQLMARSKDLSVEQQYTKLLALSTPAEKQITLDLPRTLPREEYFKEPNGPGQMALFRVLKAYALYDPEVGYCQGIAFIVAPLLLHMPEEEAFCLLVRLMETYDLRGHYTPRMEKLHLRLFQLERLVEETLPLIQRHFIKEGVQTIMYASQWFMTLFAYRFPVELAVRLFDLVFAEGVETLFKFALVLLRVNQAQILSLHFEELVDFLHSRLLDAFAENPTDLLREAAKVGGVTPRKLKSLSRDYTTMMSRQKAEENETERLRRQVEQYERENKHLQGTLQELNQEHCDLANLLVQLKLDYAHEKDKSTQLIRDVAHLQEQLMTERERAEANLQSDLDSLTNKNWELTNRQADLLTQVNDLADQLAQTKMLYAESENERVILQKKWDDLRKAVRM